MPVPGVDYKPIAPTVRRSYASGPSYDTSARAPGGRSYATGGTKSYLQNLNLIKQQQDEYAKQQAQAEQAAQERSQSKAPIWMKGLDLVGKAFKYTSGNTYARKFVPGVAAAEDVIPGVKTALDIASNPLTYIPIGGEVGLGGRLGLGLLGAAGGAAGEQAGEKYQEAGLPGGKYAPLIGGLVGGIGTFQGATGVMEKGLGGLPGLGHLVPEDLKAAGINTAYRDSILAKKAVEAARKTQAEALAAGHPIPGKTELWTNDDVNFTAFKPRPVHNTNQLLAEDIGDVSSAMQDALQTAPNPSYVYVSVPLKDAYGIASSRLYKGSKFYGDISDVEPRDAVIRIPRDLTKLDDATGRFVTNGEVTPGDIELFTKDARNASTAWKSVKGLVGDEKVADWRSVIPQTPEEAQQLVWNGQNWVKAQTPEEVAAATAAAEAVGHYAGLSEAEQAALDQTRLREQGYPQGVGTEAAPIPEGQMELSGMRSVANPRARAARTAEGRVSLFQDRTNPKLHAIVSDTLNPEVGGSTTNILGDSPLDGWNISPFPERTVVISAEQFAKSPQTYIAMYYAKNRDLLSDPYHYLGTWLHKRTGNVSLDVAINARDEQATHALMRQFNQKAAYNVATGEDLINPAYDASKGAEAVAASTAVESAPGSVAPKRVTLTHYGPKELTEIDPQFQGTGIPSEELKRVGASPNAADWFASYYEEGASPEKFFINPKTGLQTAQGRFAHTVEGNFNILDLVSPEGRAFRAGLGNKDINTALVEAGYDGYKVGDQGVVRMFGKRPVSAVNGVKVGERGATEGIPNATENAPAAAQPNIVQEIPQGNTSLQIADDGSAVEARNPRGLTDPFDEVIAARAERRTMTDPEEARRFEQAQGVRKSMEELAIDKGEITPGELASADPETLNPPIDENALRRSTELDTWAQAGHLDNPELPADLARVRDDFRQRVGTGEPNPYGEGVQGMTDAEVAARYQNDVRTPEWQKTVLKEQRPNAIEGPTAQETVARQTGTSAPGPRLQTGAGVQPGETLAALKDDLRKAGVAEDQIDVIAEKYRPELTGAAQSQGGPTEAGQAIRAASRAEALAPSPQGTEALLRQRAAAPDVMTVNGRPVISTTRNAAVDAAIEREITNSKWASPVEAAFSEAIDGAVSTLDTTPYRLEGTAPRAGGLYYRDGEIAVYNDVGATGGEVGRAETTIHLNPVDLFKQARTTAETRGISLPEALALETHDTAVHEIAHDLVYHASARRPDLTGNTEETFVNVYRALRDAEKGTQAKLDRLTALYRKMADDGTLVTWENDNARIGRTADTANAAKSGRLLAENATPSVAEAGAGLGRGEGASALAARGWGEPGAGLPAGGGVAVAGREPAGLPERGAAAFRRVERTDLRTGDPADYNPRGRTATAPGAPGQPPVVRVTTPAPRVIEEAGDGKVFETPVTGRISAAPRSMDEVANDIFKDNVFRRAATRIANSNPLLKRVLETTSGKSATAVTPLERDIATYAVKTEVDKSRIVGLMSELRQEKRPFVKMADNLTRATDWRGNDVIVSFGDVLAFPNNFILSKAQEGYIGRYHKIIDELVSDAKSQGIDIKELGLTKVGGGHYVPRWVQGSSGIDLEKPYVKGGLGAKQPFDRPRYYDTEADGMAKGVQYHDSEAALEEFANSIMKRTRDKEIISRVRGYGRTPSELAGPAARAPLDAQVLKLKNARQGLNAAQKEVDRLTDTNIAVQAGSKRLSPADVRAMVAEHTDVQGAKATLDDMVARRDVLQTKFNAAKTPASQARLEMQLDAIKGKVAQAQDDLKAARKTVRAQITGADEASVLTRKTGSKGQLKVARTSLAQAQAKYDQVFQGTKQAKTQFRQILNAKVVSFHEPGTLFGMSGDIIAVRQSRELPGLQGRIFPAEVMDVMERGLADKGSRALQGIAKVNDLARMFTTSTDFGATMLQGLPVLAHNPKAWAKATVSGIWSFFQPRYLQKYYGANRDVANEASHYIGGLSSNEFFSSAVGAKTLIGQGAEMAIPLISTPMKGIERFGVAFDTFLDVAKLEMWKSLSPMAKGDTGKLEELGRFIRNLTGTTSTARLGIGTTQRQAESLLMFSPRFTRSVFALGAQAMERGVGGDQARKALGGLIFGSMALYAGTKMALNATGVTDEGFNWKDFDPTQGGRFMAIKVGDNYIGLGGSMRGAIQLLGTAGAAAATGDAGRFLSTETTAKDANPFLKYLRGRSSPMTGEVWNVITGKNAIGEEYGGRGEWLSKLPDDFVPFGVQALVETEGGMGQSAGIFAAQTMGLRSFPESKNEDLSASLKDTLRRMPTDLPGFSQAERDQVQNWADLTKYQKMTLLQRAPELRPLLDKKEQDFWTQTKQLEADAASAKRTLGQKLLTTWEKQQSGVAPGPDDLTPEAYRNALSDIVTKTRAAENALNGASAITGLGGADYPGGARTHRQDVMTQYYAALDGGNFIDPATGMVDFNKRDEVESQYLAQLPQADQNIIAQEKGAEYDSVARDLKTAKIALTPYWNIGDQTAKTLGFNNAQEVDLYGTTSQKKRYASLSTKYKEQYRKSNPEVDALLVQWGYASKGIHDRSTGSSMGLKPFKVTRKNLNGI